MREAAAAARQEKLSSGHVEPEEDLNIDVHHAKFLKEATATIKAWKPQNGAKGSIWSEVGLD